MKSTTKKITLAILAWGLVTTTSAMANATQKYGVVDMQTIILSVNEGKQARSTLEKEIKDKEAELNKKKTELEKMNEEFQKQGALLSGDAKAKKQQEFQNKFLELRQAEMEFQAEIKRKEQKATQGIALKVAAMVEKLAKDKKLEAVFEANSSGLLYLENPMDLTKDLIDNYEKLAKEVNIKSASADKK